MSPSYTSADDKNTYSSSRSSGSEGKDDLRDAADKAGRKAREFLDNASDEISSAADTISNQINEKPVQSALIALGAGFLLGALLRR